MRLIDADELLKVAMSSAILSDGFRQVFQAMVDGEPTVEATEALEKQRPQKPRKTRYALMCARCGHKITEIGCVKRNRMYCKKCGQAIDWEEDTGG